MDHRDLDISASGFGEALIVAGEAAAAPDPADGSLDHPAPRQHLEAAGVVGALDDFETPAPSLAEEQVEAGSIIGTIGPDQIEPGEEAAQSGEREKCPVAVLDVRRMDHGAQDKALRVDDEMALASLDLLGRVITHRVDRGPPFSADLTDWLSMMPALGLASRPIASRSFTRSA